MQANIQQFLAMPIDQRQQALAQQQALTGSVNQSAVESGLSPDARTLLGLAESTDVAMAPAADMFEMGVTVQVLKRGTMFAQRGHRLADFYRRYNSLEEAPPEELKNLETTALGRSVADIWADTEAFFANTDPQSGGTRGGRSETPDGVGVSVVPVHRFTMGPRRQHGSSRRLPDLVWACDGGGLQPMGPGGKFPRTSGSAHGSPDRAQPARRSRDSHPCRPVTCGGCPDAGCRFRFFVHVLSDKGYLD